MLPYLIAPGVRENGRSSISTWIARGQAATFDGHWDVAEHAYREALKMYPGLRMPMLHTDARVGLAHALLRQGRKADAWAAFRPAYEEVIQERAIGLLLLESRTIVAALLELVAGRRAAGRPPCGSMLSEWASWNDLPVAEVPKGGALSVLSEREYEVLGPGRGRRQQQAHRAEVVAQPAYREAAHRQHPGQAGLRFGDRRRTFRGER